MSARPLLVLALCSLAACAKPAVAGPRALMSQLVTDPSGQAQVEVRYVPKESDMVELLLEVSGVGVDEMDKFAIDIRFEGFVIVEGTTQWAGFAPPRERQKHRVLLRMLDDVDSGTVNFIMTRFHDSELLWQDDVSFRRGSSSLVLEGS